MPPSKSSADARDDRGSASIEFLTVGLVLMLPAVWLVLALNTVQSASFAVEGAARHGARVYVQQSTTLNAQLAASQAITDTLADYGFDRATTTVSITCRPRPAACLTRRGFVTVRVTTTVTLPLIPNVIDLTLPVRIPIDATSTEQVSRFGGAP